MLTIKMTENASDTEIAQDGVPITSIAAIEVYAVPGERTAADCLVYVEELETILPDNALSVEFTESIIERLMELPSPSLTQLADQITELAERKAQIERFRSMKQNKELAEEKRK